MEKQFLNSHIWNYTIICLVGMKSALCRTRSKIFASSGLMKASSREKTHGLDDGDCLYKLKTYIANQEAACYTNDSNDYCGWQAVGDIYFKLLHI